MLSAQSAAEQARLHTTTADDDEDELAALNARYEDRFPGLRYVTFVNGRGRPDILADMRRRIDRGDPSLEEREAIQVGRTPEWLQVGGPDAASGPSPSLPCQDLR